MSDHDAGSPGPGVGVLWRVSLPFRRRRQPAPIQTEIEPVADSDTTSPSPSVNYPRPATTVPDLVEELRHFTIDTLQPTLSQFITMTKNAEEGVVNEFVTNGALPVLLQLLTEQGLDVQTRIRVAAAICNLSHARHAQRSFYSCEAVPQLVAHVIGEHQALTGATALMFRSMLISENLVRSMLESHAPMVLLRGLLLCPSLEISDTVVDVLIQMMSIPEIKDYLVENRAVEACVYFLHVMACAHYDTSVRHTEQFLANDNDAGPPGFTYRSMRDALIWALMHPEGLKSFQRPQSPQAPEMLLLIPSESNKDWESILKGSEVIGSDVQELDFAEAESVRSTLFMELLACLTDGSPTACEHLAKMQFALDVLTYWIRKGDCLMKQGGLLTTCFLLRNGHRGFVTLKDVVNAVQSVLSRTDEQRRSSGVLHTKYKCVAAEVVNDLSAFGGDNVRNAIAAAGLLRPMLSLLETEDYQLQHLSLRALHNVCSFHIALGMLVDYGAIPFLCRFLSEGLKEEQRSPNSNYIRSLSQAARSCLSRKRVATVSITQAEIELAQQQEQDYSRTRRLEYCTALLRCIAAVQSPDWFHDFNKCRIVPITLDALIQTYSLVMRKQALGILASIVTLRDTNASTSICLEGGCDLLFNLKTTAERTSDAESPFWAAWINFILFYLAQSSKTRRFVEQAMQQHHNEALALREPIVSARLKPDQNFLDLEWIARVA